MLYQGRYKMRIAVCFNGERLIVDCEDFHQRDFWLDWIDCDENNVSAIPSEKGVYDCIVQHKVSGDGEDWVFEVEESVLVVSGYD